MINISELVSIKDFPDYYVNRKGEVYNNAGLNLRPVNNGNGYLKVNLYNGTIFKQFWYWFEKELDNQLNHQLKRAVDQNVKR